MDTDLPTGDEGPPTEPHPALDPDELEHGDTTPDDEADSEGGEVA
jgi:hypothetical protein